MAAQTTPVTVLFSRNEAHTFDVSPDMTVHQFAEVVAKTRGTQAANITIRYGQQNLLCEHHLGEYSIGQVSTLKATVGQPRKCCQFAGIPTPKGNGPLMPLPPPVPEVKIVESGNTWDLDTVNNGDSWIITNNARGASRADGVGYKTLRAVHGYTRDSGNPTVEFQCDRFHQVYLGLVPSSYNHWDGIMGEQRGGFRLNCDTGDVTGKIPVTKGLKPCNDGKITRVQFKLNFLSTPAVIVWYNDSLQGMFTFEQLGLPLTEETLHPVISCASPQVSILLDAPAPILPVVLKAAKQVTPSEQKSLDHIEEWLLANGHTGGVDQVKLLDQLRMFDGNDRALITHIQELKDRKVPSSFLI